MPCLGRSAHLTSSPQYGVPRTSFSFPLPSSLCHSLHYFPYGVLLHDCTYYQTAPPTMKQLVNSNPISNPLPQSIPHAVYVHPSFLVVTTRLSRPPHLVEPHARVGRTEPHDSPQIYPSIHPSIQLLLLLLFKNGYVPTSDQSHFCHLLFSLHFSLVSSLAFCYLVMRYDVPSMVRLRSRTGKKAG